VSSTKNRDEAPGALVPECGILGNSIVADEKHDDVHWLRRAVGPVLVDPGTHRIVQVID
jgi:hypothetical protein